MIVRKTEVEKLLQNKGFLRAKESEPYTEIFWKTENGCNKAVLLIDAIYAHIASRLTVENARRVCKVEHPYLDEILVVLIGNGEKLKIHMPNTICFDCASARMRACLVSRRFQEEKHMLQEYSRGKSRQEIVHQCSYGKQGTYHYSWILWAFVILNFYFFIHTIFSGTNNWGISVNEIYKSGQGYRFVTYMFMHNGIRHLACNTIALITIGRILEKRIGAIDFTIIYLVGGIMAGVVSITYKLRICGNGNIQTVGASGAIFALLGALLVDVLMDDEMKYQRGSYIKYTMVTMLLSNLGWNIDIVCHIGGFVSGAMIMCLMNMYDNIRIDRIYLRKVRKLPVYGKR